MQLRGLKVFCRIVDGFSFEQAARAAGMTQPAATYVLDALERETTAFFNHRRAKGRQITRAGWAVYRFGRQILAQFDEIKPAVERAQTRSTVHLALGAGVSLQELASAQRQFLTSHQHGSVQIGYATRDRVCDQVANEEADLGLVTRPVIDRRLRLIRLRKDPLYVVCSPRHPFATLRQSACNNSIGSDSSICIG